MSRARPQARYNRTMKFRRETLIALRARRTAYRVASDFINPHFDVPKPIAPVPPPRVESLLDEYDWRAPRMRAHYGPGFFDVFDRKTLPRLILAILLVTLSALALYVAAHMR